LSWDSRDYTIAQPRGIIGNLGDLIESMIEVEKCCNYILIGVNLDVFDYWKHKLLGIVSIEGLGRVIVIVRISPRCKYQSSVHEL